jgi:hypothetical protein
MLHGAVFSKSAPLVFSHLFDNFGIYPINTSPAGEKKEFAIR